ncbi:hypothetical protein V8G54_005359 [Vigna mungo]|uniref:Uncharacterized protein n=1 Tax=Vigna mungo TaxID=3915 RepID=A0AAQ3P0A6_VIGMU
MNWAAEACIGHDAQKIACVNDQSVRVRMHRDPLSFLQELKTTRFSLKNCEHGSVCVRTQTHGSVRFGTTWVEIQLQSCTYIASTNPLPFFLRNLQHLQHHFCQSIRYSPHFLLIFLHCVTELLIIMRP